jgi:hypothetical protein
MTKLIGLLFITSAVIIAGWWVARDCPHKNWMFAVCLLALFSGAFLIVQDRATEITVKGIGTIKAAAEQASIDAQVVRDLRERIEAQSATVDLVAQQATSAKQLGEELSQKAQVADKKLAKLDTALATAQSRVGELQEVTEFTKTVLAAQNDDRKAFDRLGTWAGDPKFRFRSEAEAAWATVLDEHAKSLYMSGFTVPWRQGVDPTKFGINDLRQNYAGAPVYLRPALIEYVWKREDISKKDRLAFLADVVADDPSLHAVEYAGRFLSDALEAKLKPLAVKELLQVWNQKKTSVK